MRCGGLGGWVGMVGLDGGGKGWRMEVMRVDRTWLGAHWMAMTGEDGFDEGRQGRRGFGSDGEYEGWGIDSMRGHGTGGGRISTCHALINGGERKYRKKS